MPALRALPVLLPARTAACAVLPAIRSTLLAAAALWLLAPASAADERLWITGATVISPERPDAGRRLDVLVEGERIAAVVPAAPAGAARDAPVFDASGMFLLPGLIDSHVHLASIPGFAPTMALRHPQLARAYRDQLPRSFLRYGYTTVIDMFPTDQGVLVGFTSAPAHPDLHFCGGLPLRNGYPTHFAPAAARDRVFPSAVEEAGASEPQAGGRTPQAAVARAKQDGAICVKTFFERGFGRDRNLPVPTRDLFARIVQASHAAGLPVLLHASSVEAQRFGIEGGADVFVHGMWTWDGPPAAEPPASARAVLDRIVERRTGFMPTLQVIAGMQMLYEPGHFDDPAVRRVVPASLLEWFQSPAGRWFKDDVAGGADDARMRDVFAAILARGTASTRYLAERNAFFLFGTDTPSGPTFGNLPGLNGYLEMQRLVAAGLSLRQLLEAATLNNAKAFGLADRVGTVEAGKRANLLLLARSPLDSVQAYDTVRAVWVGGRRLDPDALEAGR